MSSFPTGRRRRSFPAALLFSGCCVSTLLLFGCSRHEEPTARAPEPSSGALQLSRALLASGQVRVEPVGASVEPRLLRTSGKGGFDEDHLSYVSSPLVGQVVEVRAKRGEHVAPGQVLAVVDSPELGAASSEFIKARADLILAERSYSLAKELSAAKAMARKDFQKAEDEYVKATADLRRTRERLISLGMPEKDLDGSLDALHVRSRLNLTAPIDGTVVERNITLGEMVGADPVQKLFVIADLGTLWVTADIYEKDLSLVRVGEEVTVEAAAWPGEQFAGRIDYVADTVDPNTRTVKVRLAVDNHRLRLKPEMFITATVRTSGTVTLLSVPLAAVHGEGLGQPYVFVADPEDRATPRPVTLGDKFDDRVVILAGLNQHDRVVTAGSILLKAEAARQADS